MKKFIIIAMLILPFYAYSATVTDVGVLPAPVGYTPTSSQCSDINETGQAACLSKALGVPYKCGFRLAKTCQRVHNTIFKYDKGQVTVVTSGIDSGYGSPTNFVNGINNFGDIAWGNTKFISDYGKIVETKTIVGGSKSVFNSKAYTLEGVVIQFSGVPTTTNDTITSPNVISNSGELAGMQWATATSTLNGVAGVGGTGLFVQQETLDHLVSLGDDPLPQTWADKALSFGWNSVRSYVYDINDRGTVAVGLSGNFTLPKGTKICDRSFMCISNIEPTPANHAVRKFVGINNFGDAVGVYYPSTYINSGYPAAWINGEKINIDEAISNTGYKVLSVDDINDSLQIIGTCLKNGIQRGCIIEMLF
ncbi:hypothetical protein [Caudoviricetes sp.]|nr:hypothetical protein [Caudoviricetes sp.]